MRCAHLAAFRSTVLIFFFDIVGRGLELGQPQRCLLRTGTACAMKHRLPSAGLEGGPGVEEPAAGRLEDARVSTVLVARLRAQWKLVQDAVGLNMLDARHGRRFVHVWSREEDCTSSAYLRTSSSYLRTSITHALCEFTKASVIIHSSGIQ